jgi:hypothetical protein
LISDVCAATFPGSPLRPGDGTVATAPWRWHRGDGTVAMAPSGRPGWYRAVGVQSRRYLLSHWLRFSRANDTGNGSCSASVSYQIANNIPVVHRLAEDPACSRPRRTAMITADQEDPLPQGRM